jgi:serine/threonine-protein kinase
MPYRQGRTVADRLDQGPLSSAIAIRIAHDVCAGLAEAHRLGVIHRDVKPGNIFLENGGRAVVLDFGLAKALASTEELTATGTILGTPAYMAPEQCRGEPVSGASDIYSLGATLYELLSGKNPFLQDDMVETLRAQLELVPRRLDVRFPHRVSIAVGKLIHSMLDKDPSRRPSAVVCLDALSKLLREAENQLQAPTRMTARAAVA